MERNLGEGQMIRFIKNGEVSTDKIKSWISNGWLTREKLVTEGALTAEQLDRMFEPTAQEYWTKMMAGDYSLDEIRSLMNAGKIPQAYLKEYVKASAGNGRFSDPQIKSLLDEKVITKADLLGMGFNDGRIDDIEQKMIGTVTVPSFTWENIPPLMPGRVDVYVLGIVGSGKSMFLAGLLAYASKAGKLRLQMGNGGDEGNVKGVAYAQILITAIGRHMLIEPTAEGSVQHIPANIKAPVGEIPLSFVEMSGEIFQKCWGKRLDEMPQRFVDYMSHWNSKVILMAIDYRAHFSDHGRLTTQASEFEFMMMAMDQYGTLQHTNGIAILITKWDESPDQTPKAAVEFLNANYRNLYSICTEMAEKHGISFEVFPFSLGRFRLSSYEYVENDSKLIYNWLCKFNPVLNEPKKKSFMGRLFGSK